MVWTAEDVGAPTPGSEKWGPPTWAKLHETMRGIPCPKCRGFGVSAINALRDAVNTKLGKPLHDAENLHQFRAKLDMVDDVAAGKVERGVLLQHIADQLNAQHAADCPSCRIQRPLDAPETAESIEQPLVSMPPLTSLFAGSVLVVGGAIALAFLPDVREAIFGPDQVEGVELALPKWL